MIEDVLRQVEERAEAARRVHLSDALAVKDIPRLLTALRVAVEASGRIREISEAWEPELNEEQQGDADSERIVLMGRIATDALASIQAILTGEEGK
jgi:hypothetical protein